MKTILLFTCIFFSFVCEAQPSKADVARWTKTAQDVTIIRDRWGIPHVYGKKDSDAVFGLMYAQCEDDFDRVEMNYIEKLGKLAMIEGEASLYEDLYIRLVISEEDAKKDYETAPAWLKELLVAFADGINFYLYKNPAVQPKLLKKFEPWYPLLWTDGSIGAISTGYLSSDDVKNFYSTGPQTGKVERVNDNAFENLDGSNGFAVAGSQTESGNSMLYINPHVSLYFRPEVHMVSEQGLNAYGAVTWGQFFIYQGFNEYNGWMHTSSNADVSDLYLEKVARKSNDYFYEYDGKQKPVTKKEYSISYKSDNVVKQKLVTTFSTHHGPVMAQREDRWVSVRSNNRSMTGLIQSWQRTKTKGFEDYKKAMELGANTSNNTVYADSKNIAYWHGNFMPKRDPKLDWGKAVDGTTAATEWKGFHSLEETVHLYNPPNGWIQNCNSTPFSAAGPNSPKASDYPRYMAPDGENYRGVNAVKVFGNHQGKFTLDKLITAGYDRYLAAFEKLVPALVNAFEKQPAPVDSLKEAIAILAQWDLRTTEESVATTLAIEWGQKIAPKMTVPTAEDEYYYVDQIERTSAFLKRTTHEELLSVFGATISDLNKRYGTWKKPWGEINRFQRISANINNEFSDAKVSFPVGFASSAWGMLPSYASRVFPGTKKRYCTGGNSFICAVEFGPKVKAKSLLAGGESGNPNSPHFADQGEMYAKGIFKDVLFYKEDVMKNAEATYRPGEAKK